MNFDIMDRDMDIKLIGQHLTVLTPIRDALDAYISAVVVEDWTRAQVALELFNGHIQTSFLPPLIDDMRETLDRLGRSGKWTNH
jgi:hypothetical protein